MARLIQFAIFSVICVITIANGCLSIITASAIPTTMDSSSNARLFNVTGEDWCIGNNGAIMCGSARVAGAIDYLAFKDMQFINAADHGRELQFAISNQHGECYNPTEAGSMNDGPGQGTTSRLLGVSVAGNIYKTTSLPAYWIAPGQTDPNGGCVGVAPGLVSNWESSKQLSFGAYGYWNAIQYLLSSTVPTAQTYVQFEAPTGYMPENFNVFFTINLATGALTQVQAGTGGGETTDPIIISTSNGQYAMGSFLASAPSQYAHYARFNFAAAGTSKWSNVWRQWGNIPPGKVLSFSSIVCFGLLEQVQQCMVGVAKQSGYVRCAVAQC